MKKIFVLVIVFLLPVIGIIIFKFFSQSYFDTKVYYQESISFPDNCDPVCIPYHISDELSFTDQKDQSIYPFQQKTIKIFCFPQKGDFMISELNKTADAFTDTDKVDIFMLDSINESHKVPLANNIQIINTTGNWTLKKLTQCVFLFDNLQKDNTIMIDQENRIRGYYDLLKRDETDSLIIETKIVLQNMEIGR